MRVGLVNEFFPPFAPGGAEWSVYQLGKALSENGHHTVVITPNYGASAFEVESGIRVHRFPFPKKMSKGRKLPGFIWHANIFFYIYSALQIYQIAKKERLELLHVQNKYSLIGSFIAACLLHIPIVCSIRDTSHICRIAVCLHHYDTVPYDCGLQKLLKECSEEYYENYYPKKSFWIHLKDKLWQIYHWMDVHLRRFFLNRVDSIVGVSQGILDVYDRSRIFSDRTQNRKAIYNFIEPSAITSQTRAEFLEKHRIKEGKIVLYVGGFSRGKGSANFIQAAKILMGKRVSVTFVMVGSGRLEENIFGIKILSGLSREETFQCFQFSSLVVVPSTCQESLSRVILEAMSVGKPVVGTRVGGTPEAIIDGQNGLIVERKNPEALANAIEEILIDDKRAGEMGEKAQEIVKAKFSKEATIVQFEKLYNECIANTTGEVMK